MAHKWHKQLKDQEKKGDEFNAADMTRSRLVPAIVSKFETELYRKINDRLVKSPMNFESVKRLGLWLQRLDDFKEDRNIQGIKLSVNSWTTFQKRHGIKYARRLGSQNYFPPERTRSCCCYSERKFLPKCSQKHQKKKASGNN